MKKIILLASVLMSSTIIFAQKGHHHANDNKNVPPTVQQSFQRDYSDYKNNNSSWDYQNNRWHTRYTDKDRRDIDVYYDRNGRRLYSQSRWDRDNVPMEVRSRIERRYHQQNYDVMRIERPGRGFMFQIMLGGNRKVYLDEHGRDVRNWPY